ncbi:MAG: D-glycerate dehydrogenase [Succiniclasticum sp.]|jgi:glyoxylate reductase|nr:D-glycerate dehydrogenase [Succiniclasticum sp.]MEE3479023.1 D-glycerate dehydrogenase [Succiniclasticum sp.]
MDLTKMKVICSGSIRKAALPYLEGKVDLKLWQQHGRVPAETWKEWLQDADAIYSTGNIRINEELLSQAPHLKVIAQASVGYDNFDLAACRAHNVLVGNTPGVLVNAVADLAYGLLIDTARGIVRGYQHVTSGLWGARKALGLGVDLYGKTLGIVGMGDIGQAIARRAEVSGMQVIYHNRHRKLNDTALHARYVSFDELLATADFIVVSVTLNPSTKGMFNRDAFAKMKDGVRFVNISRGKVVDTDALYEALKSGKVAAAGLDVTDPEPLPGDHPVLGLPNLTVTPHIASATAETRDAMAIVTAQNILAALAGEDMPSRVR